MKVQSVVRNVMKSRKMSQADVATACGMKGQSSIAMMLQGKSMRVDSLLRVLNACGYDLVVLDRGGKQKPMKVTDEDEANDELMTEMVSEESNGLRELIASIVREELNRGVTLDE